MANTDNPRGFFNLQLINGAGGAIPTMHRVADGEIFAGDPIIATGIQADGDVNRLTNGASTASVVAIALHHAADNADVLIAYPLTNVSAAIQCDDNSVITDVRGQTYATLQAAGNATTGLSGCELDASTGGTGKLECIGMEEGPGNDLLLANNVLRVRFI